MARFLLTLLLSLTLSISFASDKDHPQVMVQQAPLQPVEHFSLALGHIKQYYVKDAKDEQLFESALQGMLQGLDPHSAYLNPDDLDMLTTSTEGKFAGLGIEIDMHDGLVRIVTPLDESPASKAGLKSGDLIFAINGEPVKGLSMTDAIKKLRGDDGSTVKLTVLRGTKHKIFEKTLKRAIINVDSVKSELIDKHFAYLRIRQFQENTTRDLAKQIDDLKKQANNKLKGAVIDLRNNPGGLLDAAVGVSDLFLDQDNQLNHKELIVYTEGRIPGGDFKAYASKGDILHGLPIVVLINAGSASASEIVAGALQDHRRAVVMGEQSFGKGSVQTVLPLDNTHAIKLTTALYYTPSGRSIQATGIKPDIQVETLSVPEPEGKGTMDIIVLRENSLAGHIENKSEKKSSAKKDKKKKDKKALVHEDFQLYQAVNLLKGLNTLAG